jgi:lysozyme
MPRSRRTTLLLRFGLLALAVAVATTIVIVVGRRGVRPPFPSGGHLPGVDVSSHEPPIDWAEAKQLGLRFVIARATEGDSRKDRSYRTIRREARAAGLTFTAFHYARPDRSTGDAVKEADLFLRVSGVGPGYLLPVLDLEESGGMSVPKLQAWVEAWLEQVEATIHVKPMIYTNRDFWRTWMGDTTSFAEAGYPLYVASWGATAPAVPAEDWAGRGWTVWQTAKCKHVLGIKGCIRTDVYNGEDLRALTIP